MKAEGALSGGGRQRRGQRKKQLAEQPLAPWMYVSPGKGALSWEGVGRAPGANHLLCLLLCCRRLPGVREEG